ncbi:hypothetical protein D3C87_2166080 [compost metagenome]
MLRDFHQVQVLDPAQHGVGEGVLAGGQLGLDGGRDPGMLLGGNVGAAFAGDDEFHGAWLLVQWGS